MTQGKVRVMVEGRVAGVFDEESVEGVEGLLKPMTVIDESMLANGTLDDPENTLEVYNDDTKWTYKLTFDAQNYEKVGKFIMEKKKDNRPHLAKNEAYYAVISQLEIENGLKSESNSNQKGAFDIELPPILFRASEKVASELWKSHTLSTKISYLKCKLKSQESD